MLKIGDFSKLSQVSVKTLRYYDHIGLIHPAHIDDFTGYRYYSVEQLSRLNRILAFKDLGFSLDQIAQLLKEDLPLAQIRGMLRMRQAEIQQHMTDEQARLARVEARLKELEQEDSMSDIDVVIKIIPAQSIASIRDIVENYSAQGSLWDELEEYLAANKVTPTGACLTIDHNEDYKEKDVDLEVCEPIDVDLLASDRVRVYTLPEVETMACTILHGSYDGMNQAYRKLVRWIEASGYRISGPSREIYLKSHADTQNPDELVTEIQFPVVKS